MPGAKVLVPRRSAPAGVRSVAGSRELCSGPQAPLESQGWWGAGWMRLSCSPYSNQRGWLLQQGSWEPLTLGLPTSPGGGCLAPERTSMSLLRLPAVVASARGPPESSPPRLPGVWHP